MPDITENYAFIDGNNLHLGARDAGWIIDYRKFRTYLSEKYNIIRAFYCIGRIEANKSLYETLENEGYELVFKPTYVGKDGKIKGNCDAEVVLHCMIHYNEFNKALIIAGDGDYYCLIKYLKENQKLRMVLVPNRENMSVLIPKASENQFQTMDNLYEKIGFAQL
jgi:hypothetical protein